MTRLCTTLIRLLFVAAVGLNPWASKAADESLEPPLQYSITVGDTTTRLSEGAPLHLKGTFIDPIVTLTPEPYRVFAYQGITFRYPRSFTFEADLKNPNSKTWVLAGNDITIMYFVLTATRSTEEFADSMLEQFGRENANIVDTKASITLGKERLAGVSIRTRLAGQRIATDIYRLPSLGTETRLLTFQDSCGDAGDRSEEGRRVLEEIGSSFAIEK